MRIIPSLVLAGALCSALSARATDAPQPAASPPVQAPAQPVASAGQQAQKPAQPRVTQPMPRLSAEDQGLINLASLLQLAAVAFLRTHDTDNANRAQATSDSITTQVMAKYAAKK